MKLHHQEKRSRLHARDTVFPEQLIQTSSLSPRKVEALRKKQNDFEASQELIDQEGRVVDYLLLAKGLSILYPDHPESYRLPEQVSTQVIKNINFNRTFLTHSLKYGEENMGRWIHLVYEIQGLQMLEPTSLSVVTSPQEKVGHLALLAESFRTEQWRTYMTAALVIVRLFPDTKEQIQKQVILAWEKIQAKPDKQDPVIVGNMLLLLPELRTSIEDTHQWSKMREDLMDQIENEMMPSYEVMLLAYMDVILAEQAYIDDTGKIVIKRKAKTLQPKVPLPDRPGVD